MRSHVRRACAVAGYTDLYRESDLLPNVSIAEEARDNAEGGCQTFEEITKASIRYVVMDD